jgi:hypothetical protein
MKGGNRMRRLLLCIMLVAPALLLPQVSASATTEQCPDGWSGKREILVETDTVNIRRAGYYCFKYGTETSGKIYVPQGAWSTPDGKGISYVVCYRDW